MADVVLIGIVVLAFFAFHPRPWANSLAHDLCLLAGNGQRSCSRRPFDLNNPLFALSQ